MPDSSADGFAHTARRREAIVCADNPAPNRDYVVSLLFALPDGEPRPWHGQMIMVPDRQILACDGLDGYLDIVATEAGRGLEALTVTMFDDLNNQLIPRWLSLSLSDGSRTVCVQDGQPNWRNEALLTAIHAGGAAPGRP